MVTLICNIKKSPKSCCKTYAPNFVTRHFLLVVFNPWMGCPLFQSQKLHFCRFASKALLMASPRGSKKLCVYVITRGLMKRYFVIWKGKQLRINKSKWCRSREKIPLSHHRASKNFCEWMEIIFINKTEWVRYCWVMGMITIETREKKWRHISSGTFLSLPFIQQFNNHLASTSWSFSHDISMSLFPNFFPSSIHPSLHLCVFFPLLRVSIYKWLFQRVRFFFCNSHLSRSSLAHFIELWIYCIVHTAGQWQSICM